MKKQTQGGKRKGAGAKLKYGEPTENITIRVPASLKTEVRKLVANHLKKYEIVTITDPKPTKKVIGYDSSKKPFSAVCYVAEWQNGKAIKLVVSEPFVGTFLRQ